MRYIQRIETDDIKGTYNPENYINITLPRRIVDLHTFTVYYTGVAQIAAGLGVGGHNIKRFFPRLTQNMISTLSIEIEGRQIQKIDEYGYLYNILHDVSRPDEDMNSTHFDTISKHNVATDTGIMVKYSKLQADTNATSPDEFYIDKWLGFLNQGNRYMDCSKKNVKVQIKLAPVSVLYTGINTSGTAAPTLYERNYTLTNVYGTIDILDTMPEPAISNKFVDYMTIVGYQKTNNKNTQVSFQCDKPISWMLRTFTSPTRTTENGLIMSHCNPNNTTYGELMGDTEVNSIAAFRTRPIQYYYSYELARQYKFPYLLNNSIYFQRTGKGILSCVFNVNGYNITPKLSLLACYKETKKVFESEYKRVISLASFENDFFCNCVNFDDKTNDVKIIKWDVDIDPAKFQEGGQPIVFVCTESSY